MEIKNNILTKVTEDDIKDGVFIAPEGIIGVSSDAFSASLVLEKAYFPESVTKIEEKFLSDNMFVKEVYLPGVKFIPPYSFDRCESLQKIHIPNVEIIGEICNDSNIFLNSWVFYKCVNLREIHLPNITCINEGAFYACDNLEYIYAPNVKYIGEHAFTFCHNLKNIYLPNVCKIDNYTFGSCENLSEVVIKNSDAKISSDAFLDCERLKKIIMNDEVWSIKCINLNCMRIHSEKKKDDITIYKCSYLSDEEVIYIAQKGSILVYRRTEKESVSELNRVIAEQENTQELPFF